MNMASKTLPAGLAVLGLMWGLSGGAAAQDTTAPDPAQADSNGASESGAPPPTRVQRRQEAGQTITEYTRGGKVILMTVEPRKGPTQYWQDPDGDGQFQQSTGDAFDEQLNLPKWKLGDW